VHDFGELGNYVGDDRVQYDFVAPAGVDQFDEEGVNRLRDLLVALGVQEGQHGDRPVVADAFAVMQVAHHRHRRDAHFGLLRAEHFHELACKGFHDGGTLFEEVPNARYQRQLQRIPEL